MKHISLVLPLKEYNEKLAYGISKELFLIDLNYLYNKETLTNTQNRLLSLIEHIDRSFKTEKKDNLIKYIQDKIDDLTSDNE